MAYARTAAQRTADRLRSKAFEETVGTWLGDFKIAQTASQDKLDYWVPGIFLDVKEKHGSISNRWPLMEGVDERDTFILDELSLRKALAHFPSAYFLLHDIPGGGRFFLARADEVACVERVRVNRTGATGHAKGKLLIPMTAFRQLESPAEELLPALLADQIEMSWKRSECLDQRPVEEV
ncbi:MAG TPA: hypothetical protein VJQ57_09395 [Acidimicrobiia bacterium]|nr:hypothetical protein [Acidimicrobiia bacterium]